MNDMTYPNSQQGPWTERVQQPEGAMQQPPQPRDMRLPNAQVAEAQFATQPNFLVRTFEYIMENPLEFFASMGAAMVIRAGLIKGLLMAGFVGLGPAIAAAMLTSVVFSVGKEMLSGGPSEEELANAQNAEISGGVFSRALKRSLLSGAIAGLTGGLLAPVFENMDLGTAANVTDTTHPPLELSDASQQHFADLRPEISAHENMTDAAYAKWQGEFVEGDHLLERDHSQQFDPTPNRGTDIPDGIGYDKFDANFVLETFFKEEVVPMPEDILSPEQMASFDGKTILVDVGHYNLVNGGSHYDMGAIYDASGNHYDTLDGIVDINCKPYTHHSFGPAFVEATGEPVAIEAHINLRSAIQFGENARQYGADVIYTNLGQLDQGNVDQQFEYRHGLIEKLADAGHKPDIMISFHADGMANQAEQGLKMIVPNSAQTASDHLGLRIADASGGEVMRDVRGLNLLNNPPCLEDGVPMMILETGNLANAHENQVLRMYPWENFPPIFRGISDYFMEVEKGITVPAVQSAPLVQDTPTPSISLDNVSNSVPTIPTVTVDTAPPIIQPPTDTLPTPVELPLEPSVQNDSSALEELFESPADSTKTEPTGTALEGLFNTQTNTSPPDSVETKSYRDTLNAERKLPPSRGFTPD